MTNILIFSLQKCGFILKSLKSKYKDSKIYLCENDIRFVSSLNSKRKVAINYCAKDTISFHKSSISQIFTVDQFEKFEKKNKFQKGESIFVIPLSFLLTDKKDVSSLLRFLNSDVHNTVVIIDDLISASVIELNIKLKLMIKEFENRCIYIIKSVRSALITDPLIIRKYKYLPLVEKGDVSLIFEKLNDSEDDFDLESRFIEKMHDKYIDKIHKYKEYIVQPFHVMILSCAYVGFQKGYVSIEETNSNTNLMDFVRNVIQEYITIKKPANEDNTYSENQIVEKSTQRLINKTYYDSILSICKNSKKELEFKSLLINVIWQSCNKSIVPHRLISLVFHILRILQERKSLKIPYNGITIAECKDILLKIWEKKDLEINTEVENFVEYMFKVFADCEKVNI